MFDSYDNLPIASLLMPRRWRQSMLGLFDIARGGDAIADNTALTLHERRLKIAALRESLINRDMQTLPVWALVHARDIARGHISPEYAMQLLDAFLADTFTTRYQTYTQLEQYCILSTASLGRGFLSIAGETNANTDASDALCIALQLLNHWRDLAYDARTLGRIYLPQEWITSVNAREEDILQGALLTPAWREVLRTLDNTITEKLCTAATLSKSLKSRRLRLHTKTLLNIAHAWQAALQHQDILTHTRISPTKPMLKKALWNALIN